MGLLKAWALLLPARIASEDLADYCERIASHIAHRRLWRARWLTLEAVVETGRNALSFKLRSWLRTRKAS